jgi:hypothetical protein
MAYTELTNKLLDFSYWTAQPSGWHLCFVSGKFGVQISVRRPDILAGFLWSSWVPPGKYQNIRSVDNHFTQQYIPEDNSEHQNSTLNQTSTASFHVYLNSLITTFNSAI